MIKIILIILISLISLQSKADKIVASVDNKLIFASKLQDRMNLIKAMGLTAASDNDLKKKILEDLINEAVISKMAASAKIDATSKEINLQIKNIEDNNNIPTGVLEEILKNKNSSLGSLKKFIKAQILQMKIFHAIGNNFKKFNNSELENNIQNSHDTLNVSVNIFTMQKKCDENFQKLLAARKILIKSGGDLEQLKLDKDIVITTKHQNIKEFSPISQTMIRDLRDNEASTIFENNDSLNFIFLVKSNIIELSQNKVALAKLDNLQEFRASSKTQEYLDRYKSSFVVIKRY